MSLSSFRVRGVASAESMIIVFFVAALTAYLLAPAEKWLAVFYGVILATPISLLFAFFSLFRRINGVIVGCSQGLTAALVAWIWFDRFYRGESWVFVGQFVGGLLGMLLSILFWEPKERGPGYCGKCGYNLKGNTTGSCPECGMQITNNELERQYSGTK